MSDLEIVKQKQAHHFITKMKGKGRSPLQVNAKDVITGLVGGFVTILILALLTNMTNAVWLMSLAVGLANASMMMTRTTHSPAGADPLAVIMGG